MQVKGQLCLVSLYASTSFNNLLWSEVSVRGLSLSLSSVLSFKVCEKQSVKTGEVVVMFATAAATLKSLKCWVDTDGVSRSIETSHFSIKKVKHSLLWAPLMLGFASVRVGALKKCNWPNNYSRKSSADHSVRTVLQQFFWLFECFSSDLIQFNDAKTKIQRRPSFIFLNCIRVHAYFYSIFS